MLNTCQYPSALPSHTSLDDVDVVVLDISLANESGFDVLTTIKSQAPHVKCLMLSMYDHVAYITKALELGADGYVTKQRQRKN